MFSVQQKREIADNVEIIVRACNNPVWADSENSGAVGDTCSKAENSNTILGQAKVLNITII